MNTYDARGIAGLADLYGDLVATACGESAIGSPMTAARLEALAVTIRAELRASLGLPDPDRDAAPRDVLNWSALADSTAGCPTADRCVTCGSHDYLGPVLAITPVGVCCLTQCQQCESTCRDVPPVTDRETMYAQVIAHAGHIGVELPHLNGRHPGCPACGRLHQTWCPPYGGPGYTRAADDAEPDDGCPVCGAPTGGAPCANPPAGSPPGTASCADLSNEAAEDFTTAGQPHPTAAARAQAAAEQLPTVGHWNDPDHGTLTAHTDHAHTHGMPCPVKGCYWPAPDPTDDDREPPHHFGEMEPRRRVIAPIPAGPDRHA